MKLLFGKLGLGIGKSKGFRLLLIFLASLLAWPLCGMASPKNPCAVIAQEGGLKISDGISIFSFKNGGVFELLPMFDGGRSVLGTWSVISLNPSCLYVEGEWRLGRRFRIPTDRRIILVDIDPLPGGKIRYVKGEVYQANFVVHEVRRALDIRREDDRNEASIPIPAPRGPISFRRRYL